MRTKDFDQGAIVFEGEPLSRRRTGVGQYISQLSMGLSRLDQRVAVVLDDHDDPGVDNSDVASSGVEILRPSRARHTAYWTLDRVGVTPTYEHLAGPASVVIFSNNRTFPTRAPQIATIHDIVHALHPEFIDPEWAPRVTSRVRTALDRADTLLVDTHTVARELMDVYAVAESRIHVVPCAPPPPAPPTPGHPGAPGAIIAVGTLERRKNLVRLIEAHRQLPEALRREHPLLLIGGLGYGSEEVLRATADDRYVRIDNGVSRGDLSSIMGNAALLAQPSLYEGFGIPPVEALAAGLPLVVANTEVLREVTRGLADAYVDPLDVDSIAQGLLDGLRVDRTAKATADPYYTWEKSTIAMLDVITRLRGW